MALLIFYVTLALGVSFLCSIMEAVLLSVSPSFIAKTEQNHQQLGQQLRMLKHQIDQPLAAILSLNTIAHTVGAAGAGAQAATVFGSHYVGVISAVLTFLILVVSEIIPKTLGALYWRKLTATVVRMLVPTIWIMWPLVKLAEIISRILGSEKHKSLIQRDEFIALSRLGVQEGVLKENESRILTNLFRFNQLYAKDIMTPRTVIFSLPEDLAISGILGKYKNLQFSRIPVYVKNLDNLTGFVLKWEILQYAAWDRKKTQLTEIKRPLLNIPEELALHLVFEKLVRNQAHMAVVVDEYGGTVGLITMEDLMETLLGLEIVDETDSVEDMQKFAREQWQKRRRKLKFAKGNENGNHKKSNTDTRS